MRIAVIENGAVVDVIMAGTDYRHPLNKLLVPTDEGAIGDTYDGKAFKSPMPSTDELLRHAAMRSGDIEWPIFIIPAVDGKPSVRVVVSTETTYSAVGGMDVATVARLAQRAEKNPDFVMPVPQPRHHKAVMLTGKQFIVLHEKITDWYMQHHRAFESVKKAVKDGFIATHGQIDHPPSNVLQWPARYQDLSLEELEKEDISAV